MSNHSNTINDVNINNDINSNHSNTNNDVSLRDIMNILQNMNTKKPKKKVEKKIPRKGIDLKDFKYIIQLINKNETNEIKKFNLLLLHNLLRYTGLRVNEVLNLTKNDIERLFNDENIQVYCSKTKENRLVVLYKNERNEFLKFMNEVNINDLINKIHHSGLMNTENKKLSFTDAFRWSKPYYKELEKKLGPLNPKFKGSLIGHHSYRIEYINFVLNKGLHIDLVAQLIGHKNLQTTLIYVRKQKPLLKDLKKQFERS